MFKFNNLQNMKIGILGTGIVGKTIASALISNGHEVKIGSRSAKNEKNIAFVAMAANKNASAGTFADAAAFGEIIFNCTAGSASLDALKLAGATNLDGKILVDISNPLDFSKGMPPSLSVCNTNSLGEEIQKEFPDVKVVKTLNTIWSKLMVNPSLVNYGDHNVFICGDDEAAKKVIIDLVLIPFGWLKKNIFDLGDITKARGTEMYLSLWLSLYGTIDSGAFNVKIVR
ncbi:MAG: NAD(P)-binding domain-containing protein [Bacteroidia bacterium]|nr:NAD(P)-binding domain-containing protein [Bacteroidia bacterium]